MEKMRMETPDLTAANVEKIGALFPSCITETTDKNGKLKKAINFELLRQMLSADVVEGDEAYEFTWVGKKAAIVEANKPIRKTLRPCPEESVDWDTTENLYIEGDNLEVLKLLQESYLGKVKMIYIDPPYNTGNDFIYRDDFTISSKDYEAQLGITDESGKCLFRNTDSNGRFHSDWCSMMYPRLMLARNLITHDGVIFISIDDHESDNLKKMCDEVFGADCFVANVSWQRTYSKRNDSKGIPAEVEHIIAYSKQPGWNPKRLPRTEDMNESYGNLDGDPRLWSSVTINAPGAATHQGMVYAIQHPITGEYLYPPTGRCWSFGQPQMFAYMNEWAEYELKPLNDFEKRCELCGKREGVPATIPAILLKNEKEAREKAKTRYNQGLNKERPWPMLYFTGNGTGGIRRKQYLDQSAGRVPTNYWPHAEVGHTGEAAKELAALFEGRSPFDTPKPVRLVERLINIAMDKGDLVLDFFSGSATTAHAIIKKNIEDQGHLKFIMVQIPEESSFPGYRTLCDIGKERIRRAGAKMKKEKTLVAQNLDMGFRVFKLDSSNMKDVYYTAGDYTQDMLSMLETNVKSDRTDLDLLFGCLIEWGLPLSMPYKSEKIEGCTVHNYNDGDLIACFDENLPDTVIKEITRRQPLRAVFRDSSFNGSPAKINVREIFKMLAPDTRVKVI